jgi:hypothetical protein
VLTPDVKNIYEDTAVITGTNTESETEQEVGNLHITSCSGLSQPSVRNRTNLLVFLPYVIACTTVL